MLYFVHFLPFSLSSLAYIISLIMYLFTISHQFHFIQFLQHLLHNLHAFRALFLHLYILKKKGEVTKRNTKYLSAHERTRIRLLRQSRDSTVVRPSSFESTYISSPMGFIVQCFLKESLPSIRSTFPLLSDFRFSSQRTVPEYLAPMEGTEHPTITKQWRDVYVTGNRGEQIKEEEKGRGWDEERWNAYIMSVEKRAIYKYINK
jgi:hypothetical protein